MEYQLLFVVACHPRQMIATRTTHANLHAAEEMEAGGRKGRKMKPCKHHRESSLTRQQRQRGHDYHAEQRTVQGALIHRYHLLT